MASRPIAVVLDGPPTPAWQARALAGLAESSLLDVVEVRPIGAVRRGIALRLQDAVERRLLYIGSDALAPVSVEASVSARPAPSGEGALVVWLSERPVSEEEPRDVLYLRHGRRVEPAEVSLRRAMSSGASYVETEALLRCAGGTVVIARTVSEVRPFSVTLSRDLMLWKLADVIRRSTERAPGAQAERTPGPRAPALAPAPPLAPAGPVPSIAAAMARSLLTWPRILATRLLFRRPWSVRVRKRAPEPTTGWSSEEDLVRWTRGNLYADPFLFEHEGRHHLFCEEAPLGAARAVISHTELRLDGAPAAPPKPVLTQPYHLSYPFVFAHDDEIFLLPETSAVGRVELYRAVEFPHTWRHEAILIDEIDATDATVLADGDRLWLFAGVAAANASSLDELHLFWAHAPRGPWHAHPRNPVVSDARCARPAGAIQRWGSRLVRPGQDGSKRYGGAISFREIDLLSPDEYAEHEIARLEPSDLGDARATHTYSADTRFEAIDLRRRELRVKPRLARLAVDLGLRRRRLGREAR